MKTPLPLLSLIVAMDQNRTIGRDGDLPWRLSNDLRHFKRTTMGKPMLMGRKTWESLPGRLPGRRHLVLTRHAGYDADGAEVVHDLDAALALCHEDAEVVIIGGAQVYALALPRVQHMFVTEVKARADGDIRFPSVDWQDWREVSRESHPADDKNDYPHDFVVYERNE